MTSFSFAAGAGATVNLTPAENIASVVSKASPGTTFIFSPGTYRMQSIVPKDNDIFTGQGTVVLDGAELLEMKPDRGLWSAVVQRVAWPARRCSPDHPLCWELNDLYIDDKLQTPVESHAELGPGKWFYDDTSRKVFISTNPTGHRVEFGVTPAAFSGTATGVQISHLIVEKYASPPQHGAVGGVNGKARNWTLTDMEVAWNHGAGIAVGPGSHVEGCNIHHNGQLGLAGHGANILIQNNEFAHNNNEGFDPTWDAGGAKLSGTTNLVLRSNYAHNNQGDGLWTDIDNRHTLYEKNRVINNLGIGIHHEISYDAIIRDNLVEGNKIGILIVLSPNVEVYGNTIEVPPNGIEGIRVATGQRGGGIYGPYRAHDDYIHNNIITYLGPSARGGVSGPLVQGSNIRFDANEYHFVGGGHAHFIWGNSSLTLADMRRMGMCQHSTIKAGLPTAPDPSR